MIFLNQSAVSYAQTTQALTEIEALGLASKHDLANGHASQELSQSQQRIIENLPSLWQVAASTRAATAATNFKDAFSKLAATPSLNLYGHFKICPTASNSIDVVATWLAENNLHTALIEPTFDNLYLILKRRGVQLTSLPEHALHEPVAPCGNDESIFSGDASSNPVLVDTGEAGNFRQILKDVDAVFLVNPNNPTGRVLSQEQFTRIVEWCAVNRKVLILDNTFRFFVPQTYDTYQILLDSAVTFLSIEDTGKVWPTQEIKASLLFTSANIIREIDVIYDEIFLCHSNFALVVLGEFLADASARGLDQSVWQGVRARRQMFRQVLNTDILQIHPHSKLSTISVEWVCINSEFTSDVELVEHFKQQNLILLPGRQFYWNSRGKQGTTNMARFALLKSQAEFNSALNVLANGLRR